MNNPSSAGLPAPKMHPLLSEVIEAHGGLERWQNFTRLSATIVSGGEFWRIKGLDQDSDPRRMTVDLHREWSSVAPFGNPDWHTDFTPDRIAIVALDGSTVAERTHLRDSFRGHTMTTPWDPLHRAYFNGYALWAHLTTPFVLAEPGFRVAEIAPIVEGNEAWRDLRATFPVTIAAHSCEQDFGSNGLLRREDCHVDVAGGFAGAQLVSDFVEVQGLREIRTAFFAGTELWTSPHLMPKHGQYQCPMASRACLSHQYIASCLNRMRFGGSDDEHDRWCDGFGLQQRGGRRRATGRAPQTELKAGRFDNGYTRNVRRVRAFGP